MTIQTISVNLVTADALLQSWQAHRRFTRRTIEGIFGRQAVPVFRGGMRTFGQMAFESIGMAVPLVEGVSTGKWAAFEYGNPMTKIDLLRLWDAQMAEIE